MSDVEIGLVCYSQVQQSAVSGLTDLLKVGGHVAARHGKGSGSGLRINHWHQGERGEMPSRAFDTATEYVQQVRVGKARESLQFGTAPVDRVAWDVGYSDTSAFRKVFFRIVGLTPSQYRRRFRPE